LIIDNYPLSIIHYQLSMQYRPKQKQRHPALTLLLFILFIAMSAVLVGLLGIYVGYFQVETPTLAQRFEPPPTATRPAPLYIADGDTYFAAGKLNEAITAYEQAIQIDPTNDVPYIRQSRLLVYAGDTSKALQRAEQALLLNPASPENLAYYCRALDWEAQYSPAFDACSCAIELDPTYAEGYAFLSEVYADQANWVSARTTAQQALDANFNSLDAHHNMGYALEVQGRYAEAVKFYENAIQLGPNLAPLYIAAGRSHYWLGDFETAAERFKAAIRLDPTHAEAYDRLGWTYHTNGESARAIDALEQGIGVDPALARAWGHLGLVYYTNQNFETALEYLPKAIELAENEFVRRARQVALYAETQSLTGPEFRPILRGRFIRQADGLTYVAELKPVIYDEDATPPGEEGEVTCTASIVRFIKNGGAQPGPAELLQLTQVFSQATGAASLDLISGNLSLDIKNIPQPQRSPYEIRVQFWPNRVDSVDFTQPDAQQRIRVNIQFEEKLTAPVEYYYTLGLAYTYLGRCAEAAPWLLKSLEIDSAGYNPAWAGIRDCGISNTPPTPIPTPTPPPEVNQ
jgi:tetratricopeptide (TPR) repeat protein